MLQCDVIEQANAPLCRSPAIKQATEQHCASVSLPPIDELRLLGRLIITLYHRSLLCHSDAAPRDSPNRRCLGPDLEPASSTLYVRPFPTEPRRRGSDQEWMGRPMKYRQGRASVRIHTTLTKTTSIIVNTALSCVHVAYLPFPRY